MDKDLHDELERAINELHGITMLLRGDKDRPGLVHEHLNMKEAIYGNGQWGIIQKLNVMWRVHVWVLCTLSGLAGSGITLALHHFYAAL